MASVGAAVPPRDPYDDEDEEDEEGADEDDDREPAVIREARGRRRSPPSASRARLFNPSQLRRSSLVTYRQRRYRQSSCLWRAREADRAGDRECLFVPNSDY